MTDVLRGARLVALAREALERDGPLPSSRAEPWLLEPGATFVTLRQGVMLRGCIGSIQAHRPLGEDVVANARAAAFHDPRFPPLARDELGATTIEVSVLSPREPLPAASEAEAIERLRPGIDGVYLEYAGRSSTFLPQVWESLPEPASFLGELRRKAGLPATFWDPALRLSRYTVEKYA